MKTRKWYSYDIFRAQIMSWNTPIRKSSPEISQTVAICWGFFFRFDGFDSDSTYLRISADKTRLQCLSGVHDNDHLCGQWALNLPARDQFTPELLFMGASFRPRDGSYSRNQPARNRYTWKATHYRVMGRMAECPWLGEYAIWKI